MKSFLLFALLTLSANSVSAHYTETTIKRDADGVIKSVKYAVDDNNAPKSSEDFFTNVLGINRADHFALDISKNAKNGMSFERYQQFYRGIRVEDGHYNFRFQNGKMKAVTGHFVDVSMVNPVPAISKEKAIQSYISFCGIGKEDILDSSAKLAVKEIPSESVSKKGTAKLVYLVNIRTKHTDSPDLGFIDAHTGNVLYTQKTTYDISANGLFYTYYNRNNNDTPKSSKTEYDAGGYILEDSTRCHIHTLKYDYSDFYDDDNVWTRQEMGNYNSALDVHWTFQHIYDVLYYEFEYDSYDGNNGGIYSFIAQGSQAYYNKSNNFFCFGTSNSDDKPMGAVDVVSHEFGHAILCETTGWISNTPIIRALHEGFADIWGVIFESHITPNADTWKMGQDLYTTYSCTRNIANPGDTTAETQIADTYGTGLWNLYDEHISSGVCSHWFYLLAEGGTGINGLGNSYTVIRVGQDLAEQLFVYTVLNPSYLEDCTTLIEVKDAFYDAAYDMGYPFLADQVENAWYAVGVGSYLNSISGPDLLCGHSTYKVYNLPSDYSIQWSYTNTSNNASPTLSSNSNNNSCTVYANSLISGTLNATISESALVLGTYSKQISGDADNFIAYYWVNNTYMDVLCEDDNWASPGDNIYIQSSNFSGKTFKLSRSSAPNSFTPLTLNGSRLQFEMPNLASGEYLTLWVTGLCGTYTFNFYSSTRTNRNSIFSIESLGGTKYLLSLKQQTDENWEFQIFRIADSQLIATEQVKGQKYVLDTSTWKPGVFIIRAKINEEYHTAKLKIK